MALVRNASFAGLNANDVRPQVKTRQLQQLKEIAADQAHLWENITGFKIPPESGGHSLGVVAHNHGGGSTGQPIPLPLAQKSCLVEFTNPGSAGDYGRFDLPLVRVCPGVTTVRVRFLVSDPNFSSWCRVRWYAVSSGTVSTTPTGFASTGWESGEVAPGVFEVYNDFSGITSDALWVVSLEYYDGQYRDNALCPDITLYGWQILPWLGEPREVQPYQAPRSGMPGVRVPPTDQHLDSSGDDCPFTSFDETLFADYRSVNSYLVASMAANDALLYELASGRPAMGLAENHTSATRWKGHCHGGEPDETSIAYTNDTVGDMIDIPLGAQSFGARRNGGYAGTYIISDQQSAAGNTWSGQVCAPTLQTSASTAYQTLFEVPYRVPRGIAKYRSTSLTSRLRFACLVHRDGSKSQNTVRVYSYDENLISSGSANTDTTTGSSAGVEVLEMRVDVQDTTDDEANEILVVQARYDSAPPSTSFAFLSWCAWIEAP